MLKSVALQKSSMNSWQKVVRMMPEHGSLVVAGFFFLIALLRCRLRTQSHSVPQLQMSLTTLGHLCATWCRVLHLFPCTTGTDSKPERILTLQGVVSLGFFFCHMGGFFCWWGFKLYFGILSLSKLSNLPFWIFFPSIKKCPRRGKRKKQQGFVAGAALTNTVTQAWSSCEKLKTLNCKGDGKLTLITLIATDQPRGKQWLGW